LPETGEYWAVSAGGALPVEAFEGGPPFVLTFNGDSVSMTGGCNNAGGVVSVTEVSTLALENFSTTLKSCNRFGEEFFFEFMLSQPTVEINPDGFLLRSGDRILEFLDAETALTRSG